MCFQCPMDAIQHGANEHSMGEEHQKFKHQESGADASAWIFTRKFSVDPRDHRSMPIGILIDIPRPSSPERFVPSWIVCAGLPRAFFTGARDHAEVIGFEPGEKEPAAVSSDDHHHHIFRWALIRASRTIKVGKRAISCDKVGPVAAAGHWGSTDARFHPRPPIPRRVLRPVPPENHEYDRTHQYAGKEDRLGRSAMLHEPDYTT